MRRFLGFALAAAIVVSTTTAAGDGFFSSSTAPSVYQDDSNPKAAWSGTKEDLDAIIAQAKANYGFEDSKHLGRNATMPVPASLQEMQREIELGNPFGWAVEVRDGFHQPASSGKQYCEKYVKYTTRDGSEVVYNATSGNIVLNEKMGTHNFEGNYVPFENWWSHTKKDIAPHLLNDQYKYGGILYERDPNDPNKFYLVDGQTGKRMTKQQAKEFPTTLSDMWKDMGLICVANDAKDYEQTPGTTVNTATPSVPDSSPPKKTTSGTVNAAPAFQTQTVDNTAMKAQASAMLENAYQYASGIAADAGVGAEYQSAVAPVMSQGRAAISSIPDQQTVSVPAGSAQGGGYSSEIMDQVGTAFAEQGPCSAGILLESLNNQSK